ncbi:MAG: DUF6541 family protein [Candidatus Bathyarchaeia archaeon]
MTIKKVKVSSETVAVLTIFIFAILHRFMLVAVDPYPPGPDLGLHNSIINSILATNGEFTRNLYHMGGGASLTHPGFHFFTIAIIKITGIPDYIAQAAVAVLFSSIIVLCAYLFTKEAWPLFTAPLIAAFLAAISKHDLDMLLWGGYPNVIALAIIPSIFYLYIRKDSPKNTLLIVMPLLIGALIFTHSLSALMFMAIYLPFLLIDFLILARHNRQKLENPPWVFLLAFILGFAVASPFLIKAVPAYLDNIKRGMFTGGIDEHKSAVLLTRIIPLEIISLALIPAFSIFIFSKKYKGHLLDRVSLLISSWILIPAFSTQSFMIGLYTDYYRLLYFLVFPVITFLALLIDHSFSFFASKIAKVFELLKINFDAAIVHSAFTIIILVLSIFNVFPLFAVANTEFDVAKFYDVVSTSDFDAINWILLNTPKEAVFVSQHDYGWWISGFGQRRTLSATEPQFLIVPHEFQAATVAKSILETNFIIKNGLIEIWEDGYIERYNPVLMVKPEWAPSSIPVLFLNDSEVTIFYQCGEGQFIVDASQLHVKSVELKRNENMTCIIITRENKHLVFKRSVNVFKGSNFAMLNFSFAVVDCSVKVEYLRLIIHGDGELISCGESFGFLNRWDYLCGQIIPLNKFPRVRVLTSESPKCFELLYDVGGLQSVDVAVAVGGFKTESTDLRYVQKLFLNMTFSPFNKGLNLSPPINVFDYRDVIREWNISFIAFKRKDYPVKRFLNDPLFKLVFINDNIAIFKVSGMGA